MYNSIIMPYVKTRWGLFLFWCSLLTAGAMVCISINYAYAEHIHFYTRVVPALGLGFSLMSFFIGHVSYPRVHNLKVYIIGYLLGVSGIGYFLLFQSPFFLPLPPAPSGFLASLYALIGADFMTALLIPSFVKYRTGRHISLAVVTAQSVFLLVFRFSPAPFFMSENLHFSQWLDPGCLAGILAFLIILPLSIIRLRSEFYLGGILAGTALLYGIAWISRVFLPSYPSAQTLLFAVSPLFLEAGILIHWLTRMEHRIAYDPLLHIYNRDYCGKIISEQCTLNLTPPLAVAMVDIDHFKNVNDTHGHHAGDQVLYTVAQTICREVLPSGVVCRYGGEEMVVFFPQKTTAQAVPIVEKMRKTLEKTKTKTAKKALSVTVSCGVSCREETDQTIMDVIQAADKALYRAKEGGRNRVKSGRTAIVPRKK